MNISSRTKLLSLCLAAVLTLPSGVAFAGDPAAAASYYEQASQAYQAGEYARADELLARAFAEEPDLIYQYNRVLANQAMGDFDAALKILDAYQEKMAADPEGRFSDIAQLRARLEKAKAEAAASASSTGTTDPETNVGKTEQRTEAEVAPPTGGPVEPAESKPDILGWSLVGVGVAGLGAAALFGSTVLISDVGDRFDCEREGAGGCYAGFDDPDAQFAADKDTWETHQTLTWVSLGVGAAALIGGGALLYLDARNGGETPATASADDAKVALTPYIDADGAGGVFHISF
jgi:hypothetical protein